MISFKRLSFLYLIQFAFYYKNSLVILIFGNINLSIMVSFFKLLIPVPVRPTRNTRSKGNKEGRDNEACNFIKKETLA